MSWVFDIVSLIQAQQSLCVLIAIPELQIKNLNPRVKSSKMWNFHPLVKTMI